MWKYLVVLGNSTVATGATLLVEVGAWKVIPMALWSRVIYLLAGTKAMVSSPADPCGDRAGMASRISRPDPPRDSYLGSARTLLASKWFQLLIILAAPGSAAMTVFPSRGSWRRVSRWQWSGLPWETITTSGWVGNSERWRIALGILRSVFANHGAVTIEGPVSHGSIRTVKVCSAEAGPGTGDFGSGEKRRRKLESAFRCLTVTDIGRLLSCDRKSGRSCPGSCPRPHSAVPAPVCSVWGASLTAQGRIHQAMEGAMTRTPGVVYSTTTTAAAATRRSTLGWDQNNRAQRRDHTL
jgi:hypothetical protein